MRDTEKILDFWHAHEDEDLALATIVRKQDSGYRAVGAKKIISKTDACGLLSGGCLESDIHWTARQNWDQLPLLKPFSTINDVDSIFGYQTGCAGIIEILFEKLPAYTQCKSLYVPYGENRVAEGVKVGLKEESLGKREFVAMPSGEPDCFYEPWVEPITLCIVGCGADAPVLAEIASIMGWRVILLDYRPDYVATGLSTMVLTLNEIASHIPVGNRVAVILMTHNYEADLRILSRLNEKRLGYLGCVGPRKRFEQLKADLWAEFGLRLSPSLESIIHAPAGLFARGRHPEEIALSIASQIQFILRDTAREPACLMVQTRPA